MVRMFNEELTKPGKSSGLIRASIYGDRKSHVCTIIAPRRGRWLCSAFVFVSGARICGGGDGEYCRGEQREGGDVYHVVITTGERRRVQSGGGL